MTGKWTHTPGPWAWFGEAKTHSLYLATVHSGRRFVMQFARWGMSQSQPRFQVNSRMVDASTLLKFEVCDAVGVGAAEKDEGCYRLTINGIDHPDARLMQFAPDLAEAGEALADAVDELYEYRGGADSARADENIQDRLHAALTAWRATAARARGDE